MRGKIADGSATFVGSTGPRTCSSFFKRVPAPVPHRAPSFFIPAFLRLAAVDRNSGALSYFGEDPELTPQEFFTTLHSFIKVRRI